ncbi:putative quinol monooxygenase [Ruegeria marina]|uniref:Quinol monooxygenase YgiN n=1 Tax=Ruegeria marina TaxID=639004 RepID=A0A1G6LBA1_9RHOB|nr:putative quinol monooxygenase [Ruegeria marina]SDC40307.1 Quinol monooxygenase YgiN [Ruegeria marina]
MYVVTVTFTLHSDRLAEFMPLMIENARLSRALESGCRQFDICTGRDDGAAPEVFLYEVYESAAAFGAHLESDHFKAFDAKVGDMIASRVVRTYREVIR